MPVTTVVDFETYYDKDYSLKKLSYPEFIYDPRFKVHGLGVDRKGRQEFVLAADLPKYLPTLKDDILVVHNGFFDIAVLSWRYDFHPAYIIDTLGLANHVLGSARDGGSGRNDLDSLAERLGLTVRKGDLSFMLGINDPTPGDLLKLQEYVFGDLSITRQVLQKLLPRMTNSEFELWLLDHTLRLYADRKLAIDPEKIEATIALVEKRRTERVTASGVNNTVLSSNKQFATELAKRLKKAKVAMPMKRGKKGMIPALAKTDSGFLKLAEHPNKSISDLIRGRLVERSSTVALARLRTMTLMGSKGIPVQLVYYGAHTGRFAGGGGFNFQNLTSPDRAIDPVDREIAASIRSAIVAGDGQVFVAVDAAQIEARVLAWLAGEEQLLADFASGADIYSQFISGVLGEDIHKPKGDEPKEVQQHLKLMRGVGKIAVLGLGYNMGVDKFLLQLRGNPDAAKLIDAGKIDIKFAASVVQGYRHQYPQIVQLWTDYNNAFQMAYKGAVRDVGPIRFARLNDGLMPGKAVGITLPSGRVLTYRNLHLEKRTGKATFTGTDGRTKTIERDGYELKHGLGQKIYGGLLAENITQAVARDILAESIQRSEAAGFPVALHVHDEIVLRVPKVRGKEAYEFLLKSLSTPPAWGSGLVLSAEGRIGPDLGK